MKSPRRVAVAPSTVASRAPSAAAAPPPSSASRSAARARAAVPHLAARITVAICTHDRYALLAPCIGRLLRQGLDMGEFEILLIDNTPDARRSAAEARAFNALPNLRWIHEPITGLSQARNRAMAEATAPILAYLDDDALAEPGWLTGILDAFDALGPEVAVIGGRVLPWFVEARPAWLGDDLIRFLSVLDLGTGTRLMRPGEYAVGANIAYRLDRLRAVGGFSTALGRRGMGANLMSNDETELAQRLRQAGGEVGYAGAAAVSHRIEPSRLQQSWFRQRAAWQAVSDFVVDPAAQSVQAPLCWRETRNFLATMPPHLRTLRGLTIELGDQGSVAWQVGTVYNAVTALLGGADDSDG